MNILFNTHKVIWKDNEYVEIEDDLLDDDEDNVSAEDIDSGDNDSDDNCEVEGTNSP
jgi:hypothetical protein